jgi:hypothetical protein
VKGTASPRTTIVAAIVSSMSLSGPLPARAQSARADQRPLLEARVDYIGPRPHTAQVGVGVNIPVGIYLRIGAIGAGGTSWHEGLPAASARADVIGRFTFDPLRERGWGLSAGGGLSVRYDDGAKARRERWRGLVTLALDLEGPRRGSVAPAIQVGLGGGARVGVVLRAAQVGRR